MTRLKSVTDVPVALSSTDVVGADNAQAVSDSGPAVVNGSTWQASIDLTFAKGVRGTRLIRSKHQGPLYTQKPFYPEGEALCHLYLLHPPGGIVSGDHLKIQLNLLAEAQALVTTPGASRIYRARHHLPVQRQTISARLSPGASIEWFPMETIVFDAACVELDTQIYLSADSHFTGWEITCFGLPASGHGFQQGSFKQRYAIYSDGVPVFIDQLTIDDENRITFLSGQASMRDFTVSGFIVLGPFCDKTVPQTDRLYAAVENLSCDGVFGISLVGEFFIGRYLGHRADEARELFSAWWKELRPLLLNRPARPPRIWAC